MRLATLRPLAALLAVAIAPVACAQPAVDAPVSEPEGLVLQRGQVVLEPSGEQVAVVGGCWLSTQTCIDSAQRLAAAEARAEVLSEPVQIASTRVIVVSLLVGAALGAATAVGFHQIFSR